MTISNLGMPRMEIDEQGAITEVLEGKFRPNEVTSQKLSRSLLESYIDGRQGNGYHKPVEMNMMEAILYTMGLSNGDAEEEPKVRSMTDRTGRSI